MATQAALQTNLVFIFARCMKQPPPEHLQSSEKLQELLHRAAISGQEVVDVQGHRLGQVGHGAEAAAGRAVVQQAADACRGIPLQHVLISTQGFLHFGQGSRKASLGIKAIPLSASIPSIPCCT